MIPTEPIPSRPWLNEPNALKWTDQATGLRCFIRRNDLGALVGYVRLPHGHKFADRAKYMPAGRAYRHRSRKLLYLPVHGGITFHGQPSRLTGGKMRGVWVGFDCAHCRDLVPAFLDLSNPIFPILAREGIYRDIAYVKAQVLLLSLAQQIMEIK